MKKMSKLSLEVDGAKAKLSNENIQLSLTAEGKADSLIFHGQELLDNLQGETGDPDAHNSFYCDYHVKGGTVNTHPNKMKIIENTSERIHIAYIDDVSKLGVAYHFILHPADNAIFSYVKAWNNSDSIVGVDEFRTVYRLNHDLFYLGRNAERLGYQPSSAHMVTGKKLQDETYELDDGSLYSNSKIYSKYDYSGYFKDNDFWGQMGSEYGFWFIPVDRSSYDAGPLNQDLLLHYDGLILNYMASSHLGKDRFDIPIGWSKVYGPWCIYLNEGKNKIEDVKKRVQSEQAKWPYQWVEEEGYSKSAVEVKGKVQINGQSPKDPMQLVLSQDCADNDFLKVQSGYSFDAVTENDGSFVMNNVRPGNYTVYMYAKGGSIVGTYKIAVKQVTEDLLQDWGVLNYEIKEHNLIWQIGKSTHTTKGFKFSDQLRNYVWQGLVPDNLNFEIGSDDRDWYYMQNDSGKWNINFSGQLAKNVDGPYELVIAFAGTTQKDMKDTNGVTVKVSVNGHEPISASFANDKAAYRSALINGSYGTMTIEVDPKDLNFESNNTIQISTNGYILYDTLIFQEK